MLLDGSFIRADVIRFKYYLFILETIDTKLYKPEQTQPMKRMPKFTCRVKFYNKALELI